MNRALTTTAPSHRHRLTGQVLTSNGRPIVFDDRHFGDLRESNDLLGDGPALRERFQADGYVLIRELLDPDEVRSLRADYYASFETADAAASHGVAGHPAHAFVRDATFRAFVEQPALREVAETVLEAPATLLPRRILRDYRQGTRRASRAHTDFPYIDAGTGQVLTAWIPIGDCTVESGGLVYLERSHELDPGALRPVRTVTDRPGDERPISHDLAWVAERLDRRWLATDFAAGDVVFHSPHIVHASLDAMTGSPRLSTDIRFIPADDPADPRWQADWSGDDGY